MAETRQPEFIGTIKKCPNCGQALKSFQAKCPACGHEITGIGANVSVKEFFDTYNKETDKARQLELIGLYPVPNTKEDILEFAMLASQQIKSLANSQASRMNLHNYMYGQLNEQGGIFGSLKSVYVGNKNVAKIKQEDFYIAWKDKLEQVHLKAQLAFGEDRKGFEQLSKIVSEAIEAVNNLESKKKKTKKIYLIFVVAISFLAIVLIVAMPKMAKGMTNYIDNQTSQIKTGSDYENERLESLLNEIQTAISNGDYDSAELKLADLRWKYGDTKYHQADIDSWDAKRNLLQKQLDSKRNGGN